MVFPHVQTYPSIPSRPLHFIKAPFSCSETAQRTWRIPRRFAFHAFQAMVVVNRRILPVFFNIAMEAVAHLWRIYLLNKVVFNSYVFTVQEGNWCPCFHKDQGKTYLMAINVHPKDGKIFESPNFICCPKITIMWYHVYYSVSFLHMCSEMVQRD